MCQTPCWVYKSKHSPYHHGFYRLLGKADNQIIAQVNIKLIIKWDKCYNSYKAYKAVVHFPSSVTKKHNPTN